MMDYVKVVLPFTILAACVVILDLRLKQVEKDMEWCNGILNKEIAREASNG